MKKFLSLKKFTVLLAAVVLAAATCMSGCVRIKGDIEKDYPVDINLDKNISAKLSILIPIGEYEENIINSLILGFNDIYPNVEISKQTVQLGDSYEQSIMTLFQSKTLPDIIWSNSTDYYYLLANKIAVSLNPFVEASEAAGVFNVENDFYQSYFDICTREDELYMVPRSADCNVTLINTSLFEQAGIGYDAYKDGWTWEEFKTVCGQFRNYYDNVLTEPKTNYYPVSPNIEWEAIYGPMLSSYNAQIFDENNNVAIDSAATREVVAEIRDLVSKKYIPKNEAGGSAENSFYSGNQPMLFQSEPISRNCETAVLKGKVDVLPFPLMDAEDNPRIGCGAAGYCLNSESKVRDVAWAFLNYMLTEEGQQAMAASGAKVPPIRRDLADFKTAKWGEGYRDKNLGAYTYGEEYRESVTFFMNFDPEKKSKLLEAVQDLVNDARDPKITVEKCISNCVEGLNYALKY